MTFDTIGGLMTSNGVKWCYMTERSRCSIRLFYQLCMPYYRQGYRPDSSLKGSPNYYLRITKIINQSDILISWFMDERLQLNKRKWNIHPRFPVEKSVTIQDSNALVTFIFYYVSVKVGCKRMSNQMLIVTSPRSNSIVTFVRSSRRNFFWGRVQEIVTYGWVIH